MTKPNYAYQNLDDTCATAYGRNLPVSTKNSVELCSFLRGKSVDRALAILNNVLIKKEAIPFRRFTNGVGHRRGNMASGRYPQKLSLEVIHMLKAVKFNAENKGLSDSLKIVHMCAHKASTPFHQGRQRRRAMKRTHIELVVKEDAFLKKKNEAIKSTSATSTSTSKKTDETNTTKKVKAPSKQEGEQK